MQQCSFLDDSSRFTKLVYGGLIFAAFLLRSEWLVLFTSILAVFSALSPRLNVSNVIYHFVKRNFFGKDIEPVHREPGEVRFSYAMAGTLIFAGFLLLRFTPYAELAWVYILFVSSMLFIACFLGFCAGILLYIACGKLLLKMKAAYPKR